MLKLDQMVYFSDLHHSLESPLYRVFRCSTSFLAPPCLLKRKGYGDALCGSTGYGAEDFIHSDRISMEGISSFFFPNLKAFMQQHKYQHTLAAQNEAFGTQCIQGSQPPGYCTKVRILPWLVQASYVGASGKLYKIQPRNVSFIVITTSCCRVSSKKWRLLDL